VLFQILDNLRIDDGRRFWLLYSGADGNLCDIEGGLGQMGMEVEIPFSMSHNAMTSIEEYVR
jgi:hypothetical protein